MPTVCMFLKYVHVCKDVCEILNSLLSKAIKWLTAHVNLYLGGLPSTACVCVFLLLHDY